MLNILNMVKTGIIGELYEFKFDFEFDEASTLPVNFVVMEQKRYLIAEDSTAKNVSTNTYYTYNGVGKKWVKTLSKTPMPTPTTDTNITENGNYSVVNNDTTGYNDVTVNVFSEPVVLINKDITINGNYNASSDNANGYSTVNVNVPNTYTVNDNGKVVTNQTLVAQTAYPTEITENDTYDTTNYNSITVNVSGGGGSSFATVSKFNYINDYTTLLVGIEIPDGVETIEPSAFYGCSALTSVTIPNSVTSIGQEAFNQCQALETVTFEKKNSILESIGLSAFNSCQSLTSITIPNSVTSIGEYAFAFCSALETVTFEENSILETIGESAFSSCSALSSITIPNSVTSIGGYAFSSCSALSSITIPNSVTSIGGYAFEYCSSLETITFEPTTPPTLDEDLGLLTTCTIRVPQGTLSDYTSASNYPDPSEYTYEEY